MLSLKKWFLIVTLGTLAISTPVRAQEGIVEKTCTISGFIQSGDRPITGVQLRGLPGRPVTDSRGRYAVEVPYGWNGTVTPVKDGFIFDPPIRNYTQVKADCVDQTWVGQVIEYTLAGNVGVAGASLKGLPGLPISDSQGNYRTHVPYGWSGAVSPHKKGYRFKPSGKRYAPIKKDYKRENYQSEALMMIIEGAIIVDGKPIPGVTIVADNRGGSDTTDSQGRYRVKVPYGWSGSLTPSKDGWRFSPEGKDYDNVTEDIDECVREQSSAPLVGRQDSKIMVIPTGPVSPKQFTAISQDMQIMLHILKQSVQKIQRDTNRATFALTDFGEFFDGHGAPLEAMYIQDYGVLFFLKANVSVSPVIETLEEPSAEATKNIDRVWQRATQEVFQSQQATRHRAPKNQPSVDELVDNLIPLLKHASNLSHLSPEQIIIVTVLPKNRHTELQLVDTAYRYYFDTARSQMPTDSSTIPTTEVNQKPKRTYIKRGSKQGPWQQDSSPTIITIHAHKKDIDAFATDQLTQKAFQERVTVSVY